MPVSVNGCRNLLSLELAEWHRLLNDELSSGRVLPSIAVADERDVIQVAVALDVDAVGQDPAVWNRRRFLQSEKS